MDETVSLDERFLTLADEFGAFASGSTTRRSCWRCQASLTWLPIGMAPTRKSRGISHALRCHLSGHLVRRPESTQWPFRRLDTNAGTGSGDVDFGERKQTYFPQVQCGLQ